MIANRARILFVDDNKENLDALKKLLATEDWDCQFVPSGEQALNLIDNNEINLLVTNVDMPVMDGIELLREVTRRRPEVVRIFLAAQTDEAAILQALSAGYAQQIIPIPWIEQELKEIIRSALRQSLQQKKHSLQFQTLINSIPLLPALPESYLRVQNCIMDDEVDIEKMADQITQDVAMTSALLHWANSALFGQRFRVDTIKKAIIVLGTDIVTSLILSEAVSTSMAQSAPQIDGFELKRFKCHSIATAILARMLAKSVSSTDGDYQDRVFIAGLLHDLGKLLAASHFSIQFSTALEYANEQNCPVFVAEQKILGTTHAELGSFLVEWWNLPHFIGNAIASHHTPHSCTFDQDVVSTTYLANLLSYHFGYGCNGEQIARQIDQEIRNKFYLTEEGVEILQNQTREIIDVLCSQE